MPLASGREGVLPEAVASADLAITTVDQQFRLLVLRNLPRMADGIALCCVDAGNFLRARAADGPSTRMGHNVLISAFHDVTSFLILKETDTVVKSESGLYIIGVSRMIKYESGLSQGGHSGAC